MTEPALYICPSLLVEHKEENKYSKKALGMLFNKHEVSIYLPYERFDDNNTIDTFTSNSNRISVSGVQIKYLLQIRVFYV